MFVDDELDCANVLDLAPIVLHESRVRNSTMTRQSYRVVEDEFGRSDSSGRLLDSVHNALYHG